MDSNSNDNGSRQVFVGKVKYYLDQYTLAKGKEARVQIVENLYICLCEVFDSLEDWCSRRERDVPIFVWTAYFRALFFIHTEKDYIFPHLEIFIQKCKDKWLVMRTARVFCCENCKCFTKNIRTCSCTSPSTVFCLKGKHHIPRSAIQTHECGKIK